VANVLIGCEYSGVVRRAFAEAGHHAVSVDLLPSDDNSPMHYQGDLLEFMNFYPFGWDLAIFHPPCTRLCNSGVRWLHERNLWEDMREAAHFFEQLLNSPFINRVAVENPVMHKYAAEICGKPSFTVQPWMFGDNYKKRTCFWTKNLPSLVPTSVLDGSTAVAEVHKMSPSKDRGLKRSKTYPGLAKAMAEQWGSLLNEDQDS